MIEGLVSILKDKDQAGVAELQALLQEIIGDDVNGRLLSEEKLLRSRVYRLRFEIKEKLYSFVVKRLTPNLSQLEQTVVGRWLPQVGLKENGPPLIGVAAERKGRCIWHVYDDLGDSSLVKYMQDEKIVRDAVNLLARVHTCFEGHLLLGECRIYGTHYGVGFFSSCVLEAIRILELVRDSKNNFHRSVVESLLRHLSLLFDTRSSRERMLAEFMVPETVLHGDLWTNNFLVDHICDGVRMLLIDWDHIGVGPVTYDISTLLLRFPQNDRVKIVQWYQEATKNKNWKFPDYCVLNKLFETAEYARLANATIWPAISAAERQAEWAFDELEEINGWFENVRPVLPLSVAE